MATTMFGKLLNRIREERQEARAKTESDLWKRNKLTNPTLRTDYRIEEKRATLPSGNESLSLELWHRVDSQAVVISTQVVSKIVKEEVKEGWS